MASAVADHGSIEAALGRLNEAKGVRASLSGGSEVAIDRPLPFLFVHRPGPERTDVGTGELLLAEASYLVAGESHDAAEVRAWVRALAEAGSERFGAFLVLEVWSADSGDGYRVRCPEGEASESTSALAEALTDLAWTHGGTVELEPGERRGPDDLDPLLTIPECHEMGVLYFGVELPPTYRVPGTRDVYPVYLRTYREHLSRALRRAAYAFAQVQTGADLNDVAALGRRTVEDSVWAADAALAAVEHAYRFLLLVTPTNAEEAWERFREADFAEPPIFHYRLLPVDPALLKRRLFAIELETIADPSLGFLLRDKRDELDRQLSMLAERQTPAFLHGSIRLFGATSSELRARAREILDRLPSGSRRGGGRGGGGLPVDASAFVRRAEQEIASYMAGADGVRIPAPQLRPDVVGLLVSEGVLMVGRSLSLEPRRVEALIHHEVGTHVLTYANGGAQPLKQLSSGLAGYDEFQEGLAVIGEYLAGGLTVGRLRLLAGRVLAVANVEQCATFMDTFGMLREEHGFGARVAFNIAARVHQSGGFTRDMIYLRGLIHVLELLADGADLDALYMGKFAAKHIPVLRELRIREVLREPPLRPRVLDLPHVDERLARLRRGIDVAALAEDLA
ncbi:MAG: flavohemoglobin expression-modulating QEGLA motif protein [Longimicrobiales bacterium]